jgi:Raf kinase inhibitor-like YbhB/YbcL family protein
MFIAATTVMRTLLPSLIVAAVPVAALADAAHKNVPAPSPKAVLDVRSTAFRANEAIPPKYTCNGTQATPPLTWSAVPPDTKSVAIFVEDTDAPGGSFTHWLVTGVSPSTTSLPAGAKLPSGATAGKNSKGQNGYTGPCPPTGVHHYHFRVYALDTTIPAPASKAELESAIEGHVLAQGELIGTYQKPTAP